MTALPIRSVEHLGSAADPRRCPGGDLPEVAFAGRSNVGKSSLLNALLGRKVARVSATPGRTQLLQFFAVNGAISFADLPGFGWAAVSRAQRASWKRLVEGYFTTRRELRVVVLILDVRRDPGDEERGLCAWLAERGLPFVLVATKCDKIGKASRFGRLRGIERTVGGQVLAFSAATGEGREALWHALGRFLEDAEAKPHHRGRA